jgi:Tannase and feruloyl esterase
LGIIAGAPGMSLPRAAIAEACDTQSFAQAAKKPLPLIAESLAQSFSDGDLQLVRYAVLSSCDQLDGLKDGMINNFPACKSEHVLKSCEKNCVLIKKMNKLSTNICIIE